MCFVGYRTDGTRICKNFTPLLIHDSVSTFDDHRRHPSIKKNNNYKTEFPDVCLWRPTPKVSRIIGLSLVGIVLRLKSWIRHWVLGIVYAELVEMAIEERIKGDKGEKRPGGRSKRLMREGRELGIRRKGKDRERKNERENTQRDITVTVTVSEY